MFVRGRLSLYYWKRSRLSHYRPKPLKGVGMHPKTSIVGAIVALAASATIPTAFAATHPHRPALRDDAPAPSYGTPLDCGTYKGNENQSRALDGRFRAEQRRREAYRLGPVQAPMSFINDDVWIVEDDGTLIKTGNNPFDLNNQTLQFVPNGGGYDVSSAAFTWDATFGGSLVLGDDDAVNQAMSHAFPYYGVNWNDVWVNANGALSFGDMLNGAGFYDDNDFFSTLPKLAALYIDLNPSAGGAVHYKTDATHTTITWSAVPEYATPPAMGIPCTFQVVFYNTGTITLTFNGVPIATQANGLPIAVGLHPGGGPTLDLLDFTVDLPFAGPSAHGIYEEFLVLTNPKVNEVALTKEFYNNFPDDFFQIVFFTNWAQTMGGFANEVNIKNNIQGIGLGIFDNSATWGSAGKLESRCNMNRLAAWPSVDPTVRFGGSQQNFLTIMGQESGHRWGAFMNFVDQSMMVSNLILGRAEAHWSYFTDVDHSCLEGGDWVFWAVSTPPLWQVPTMIDYFSEVDEYTFGVRTPEEVSDMFFVSSATNNLPQNRSAAPPSQGTVSAGDSINVAITDIIAAEGPRVPPERADKDPRMAFILLVQNGNTPTAGELAQIAGYRSAWEDYFEVSVDGRLSLNTSITQTFDVAAIEGLVRNKLTTELIDEFTATSIERGFVQHVPGGGRYTFRYMANGGSGPSESVNIAFVASGFEPETLSIDIPYDSTVYLNANLTPILPIGVPEDAPDLPSVATLHRNVPNPFNPTTTISYTLPEAEHVHLAIYDVQGRLVRTLLDEVSPSGTSRTGWDGTDDSGSGVGSGVYFVRFESAGRSETQKIVLLK